MLKHQVSLSVEPELDALVVAICDRQSVGKARMSKAKVLHAATEIGLASIAEELGIPVPVGLSK